MNSWDAVTEEEISVSIPGGNAMSFHRGWILVSRMNAKRT